MNIRLMEEILHQLRLVVCPIIYKVLYIPGGYSSRISSINSMPGDFFLPFHLFLNGSRQRMTAVQIFSTTATATDSKESGERDSPIWS